MVLTLVLDPGSGLRVHSVTTKQNKPELCFPGNTLRVCLIPGTIPLWLYFIRRTTWAEPQGAFGWTVPLTRILSILSRIFSVLTRSRPSCWPYFHHVLTSCRPWETGSSRSSGLTEGGSEIMRRGAEGWRESERKTTWRREKQQLDQINLRHKSSHTGQIKIISLIWSTNNFIEYWASLYLKAHYQTVNIYWKKNKPKSLKIQRNRKKCQNSSEKK